MSPQLKRFSADVDFIGIRCDDDLVEHELVHIKLRSNIPTHHRREIRELFVAFWSDDLICRHFEDVCRYTTDRKQSLEGRVTSLLQATFS